MKTKITTVLFDLDGVLINSAKLVSDSFDHTFAAFNMSERFESISGSGLTIAEVYGQYTTKDQLLKFMEAHAGFQKNNLHLVTAFEDALSTLRILRDKGIHIGIITNRSMNARNIIEHCELTPLVDFVVSVEDVKNPKPHPEEILKAIAHFDSNPAETIMVGDMPVDIQAGKAAGVITVATNTSDCLDELKKSHPNHIVQALAELIPLFFE